MSRLCWRILLVALLATSPAQADPHVKIIGAEAAQQFGEAAGRARAVLAAEGGIEFSMVTLAGAVAGGTRGGDCLLPLGTEATRWALANRAGRPVVFAMVLHPVPELIASMERPPPGVTGACLDLDPRVALGRVLPLLTGVRRVGILLGPSGLEEDGLQLESALRHSGLEPVTARVPDESALPATLALLLPRCDMLWALPDPMVFSELGAPMVLQRALERRVPVLGFSRPMAAAGAPFALVPDFGDCGEQAARLVRSALGASSGKPLPVVRPRKLRVIGNRRILQLLVRPLPKGADAAVDEWIQ